MILALDTATDRPSFALGSHTRALAHRHDLSRDIDRTVRDLVSAAQVTARDIEKVVVADGPGSFTGLRIGIAFAKGFCNALGIPLVAVPSLMGAAFNKSDGQGTVVAEYDAMRGEVFRAVYRFEGGRVETIEAPGVGSRTIRGDAILATEADASAAALLHLPGIVIPDIGAWEPDYGRLAEAEARLKARNAAG